MEIAINDTILLFFRLAEEGARIGQFQSLASFSSVLNAQYLSAHARRPLQDHKSHRATTRGGCSEFMVQSREFRTSSADMYS